MALQKSLAANAPTSKNLPGVKSRTQLLFLDDLNSADVDEFGIQPPLELLRQILSQGNNTVFFSIDSTMIYIWEVEEIGLILRGFKQLTK